MQSPYVYVYLFWYHVLRHLFAYDIDAYDIDIDIDIYFKFHIACQLL